MASAHVESAERRKDRDPSHGDIVKRFYRDEKPQKTGFKARNTPCNTKFCGPARKGFDETE